jgi:hypothetical protein
MALYAAGSGKCARARNSSRENGLILAYNVGKFGASLRGQARSRLTGDKDAPQNGVLRLAIFQELLVRLPRDITLDELDRVKDVEKVTACLGGIDFTGELENRLATDGILVVFDRARQQIDLAREDTFDFLVEVKEVPTKMDIGLECHEKVDVTTGTGFTTSQRAENFHPGDA